MCVQCVFGENTQRTVFTNTNTPAAAVAAAATSSADKRFDGAYKSYLRLGDKSAAVGPRGFRVALVPGFFVSLVCLCEQTMQTHRHFMAYATWLECVCVGRFDYADDDDVDHSNASTPTTQLPPPGWMFNQPRRRQPHSRTPVRFACRRNLFIYEYEMHVKLFGAYLFGVFVPKYTHTRAHTRTPPFERAPSGVRANKHIRKLLC